MAALVVEVPRWDPLPVRLASAGAALDGLVEQIEHVQAAGAGVPQVAARLREVDRLITRWQAVRLALVRAADTADVAGSSGASGTSAWLAGRSKTSGAAAAADVALARDLAEFLPMTRQAMSEGDVPRESAAVIARTMRDLPPGLSADRRAAVEQRLVARAREVSPAELRRLAARAVEAARLSAREVAAHEDRVQRSEEERARARARLSWRDNTDGTTDVWATLPSASAAVLVKAVQQMTAPRRARTSATHSPQHAAPNHAAPQHAAPQHAAPQQGAPQQGAPQEGAGRPVTAQERANQRGLAFADLLEHLPTDRLHGKVAATVVVTMSLAQLHEATGNLGTARLDTGHAVSGGQARRLACGAGLVPAVLGGASLPLDLGRAGRFFTEAHRTALATVYDTCAARDCDRPYAWTELHHEDPWSTGGTTDLAKAVPLCGHHHRRVHDPTYQHSITTDRTGRKQVTYTRRT
ncbi:HNH endonuclease signature motif containing protein [Aquipuribacter sp. SD81]|uniref:HNH endonuclease signature motif containing protein n=1 Tax=Aquipuribacter sp. SD81 TaxID=3127703 RepID=UPI003017A08E